MLSASFLGRPERLRHYFLRAEREPGARGAAGRWWGGGARLLGLEGEPVSPQPFLDLLHGRLPPGGVPARRRGLDLTFSAPKSVSVAALVEGDGRWIDWHEEAVERVLRAIETRHLFSCTKHPEPGLGLLVARFRHGLARSGDPQLHTHALLLSRAPFAHDVWRPFDPWPILRLQKVLGLCYRHHLARRARSLGWELRPRGLVFECTRYPESLLASWSQRARAIETDLARMGLDRTTASARRKAVIALKTRRSKDRTAAADCRERWRREARERDPGWTGRRPSAEDPLAEPHGRDLLLEAVQAGVTLGRTSVMFADRGLAFRELEIRYAVTRDVFGRSGEGALERAWVLARRAGLFVPAAEPPGPGTPRTGWDRWYRPRGAERWCLRVASLVSRGGTRAPDGGVFGKTFPELDVRAHGYSALLRRLGAARDLGIVWDGAERSERLAARTCRPARELLAAAGHARPAPQAAREEWMRDTPGDGATRAWGAGREMSGGWERA